VNVEAAPLWTRAPSRSQGWGIAAVVIAGSVATAAAVVVGDGNLAVAVAPVLGVLLLGALWLAPLRLPLFALTLLVLGTDATSDGPWDSPLAPLGRLLTHNLNKSVPIEALSIPLMALALVYLLLLHLYREAALSRIDRSHALGLASPLRVGLACSFLTVIVEIAYGSRADGNLQMAKIQVQTFVLLLLTAYLMGMSLRGVRDYRILGRLVVAAACSKALMVIWVHWGLAADKGWEVATTHGDSLLFCSASVLLLARLLEQPTRRHAGWAVVLLPLFLIAMVGNNRRLAWVEIAAAITLLYVVSRRSRVKRLLTRAVIYAIPLLVLYVAVGWNSNSRIFAPVRTYRSVGDGNVDPSTLFRDLENYNLLQTLRSNPILGTGFGHPFTEYVVLPDISFYKEYHYMPHNSVLGLWTYTGWLGFSGLSIALVAGVLCAARSYRVATKPEHRVAALASMAIVLIYLVQCWGDIGFSEKEGIFLVGSALAVMGQLPIATGAWATVRETKFARAA
jgi:hypothetical protein